MQNEPNKTGDQSQSTGDSGTPAPAPDNGGNTGGEGSKPAPSGDSTSGSGQRPTTN